MSISQNSLGVNELLKSHLLPSVEQYGIEKIVLATQPLRKSFLPDDVKVTSYRMQDRMIKSRGRKAGALVARWPRDHQIAMSVLYAGYICRGEADLTVGDAILQCRQHHFVFFPPDTPMPDGSLPHCDVTRRRVLSSDILWFKFWPYGVECHLCHTRGRQHFGGGFGERAFIANRQICWLGEMLLHELCTREPGYVELSRHYLLSILRIMQRHLEAGDALPQTSPLAAQHIFVHDSPAPLDDSPEAIVQRTKDYIRANLGSSLSLQGIARAVFTSRASLAKNFKELTGHTVWDYVTHHQDQYRHLVALSNNLPRVVPIEKVLYCV